MNFLDSKSHIHPFSVNGLEFFIAIQNIFGESPANFQDCDIEVLKIGKLTNTLL
jgi:hypothetical protein